MTTAATLASRGGTDDMAWIPSATFRIGSDARYAEEAPGHHVAVDGFRVDFREVSSRHFAAFVDDTGYVTVAERPLDPLDFPGAPAENLVPGSPTPHGRGERCRASRKGSFLCADGCCLRCRPAARRPQMIDTGMSHIGFCRVREARDAWGDACVNRRTYVVSVMWVRP